MLKRARNHHDQMRHIRCSKYSSSKMKGKAREKPGCVHACGHDGCQRRKVPEIKRVFGEAMRKSRHVHALLPLLSSVMSGHYLARTVGDEEDLHLATVVIRTGGGVVKGSPMKLWPADVTPLDQEITESLDCNYISLEIVQPVGEDILTKADDGITTRK